MKKFVEDWIFMADRDLKAAEWLMTNDEPLTNIAAFHCHQAIEKYLKAYLIEHDVSLGRIHDLIKINKNILKIKDIGINKNKLKIINDVHSDTRYPGGVGFLPDGLPTNEEVKEFIEYAREVQALIQCELKKSLSANV